MVAYLLLLSCESSVYMKENPDRTESAYIKITGIIIFMNYAGYSFSVSI